MCGATNPPAPVVVVLMGVAGSGKSTVGSALAGALGWRFLDADAFHPPANIARMAAGVPLNDDDRAPWLAALRAAIDAAIAADSRTVLACSALKASYRRLLAIDGRRVVLVFLHGPRALLAARLAARSGHFAPPSLLDSQLATLEPPGDDALVLDVAAPPAVLVAAVRERFGL